MNLSPKQRFQKNAELAKAHLEWCAHPTTHATLETALAQYAMSFPESPAASISADYHQRLQGARDLIFVLLNLSEHPIEKTRTRSDNLPIPTPKSKE